MFPFFFFKNNKPGRADQRQGSPHAGCFARHPSVVHHAAHVPPFCGMGALPKALSRHHLIPFFFLSRFPLLFFLEVTLTFSFPLFHIIKKKNEHFLSFLSMYAKIKFSSNHQSNWLPVTLQGSEHGVDEEEAGRAGLIFPPAAFSRSWCLPTKAWIWLW